MFARTKEVLLEFLPPAPAPVYDIGGAYGEYSWFLSALGYTVHLFDISETNIRMSAGMQDEYSGVTLHSAEVADARSISRPDASADAILFMGPPNYVPGTCGNRRPDFLLPCIVSSGFSEI